MKNIIAALIVILILTFAIIYIVKQKKKGVKCIGCPSGGCCNHKNCPCSNEKN